MKELIIQLTKGKEAILQYPTDLTSKDFIIIHNKLSEVLHRCPHHSGKFMGSVYDGNTRIARCKNCNDILN